MNILVVCGGNTCRSPMFAEILRRRLRMSQDQVHTVESAGTFPDAKGKPAAREWQTLLGFTGIDLTDHVSKHVDQVKLEKFDLIISLDREISGDLIWEYGVLRNRLLTVSIPNPFHQREIQAYVDCFHTINQHMIAVLRKIRCISEVSQGSSVE